MVPDALGSAATWLRRKPPVSTEVQGGVIAVNVPPLLVEDPTWVFGPPVVAYRVLLPS